MKTPLRVPAKITSQIEKFAKKLKAERIEFIDRRPQSNSVAGNCYNNVRTCVEDQGGHVLTGWAVRIWPRVLIEAEAHAIWQRPDRSRIDVSPHLLGDTNTLFLETRYALFASNGLALQRNRYLNIAVGKLRASVRRFLSSAVEKQEYDLKHRHLLDGFLIFSGDPKMREQLFDTFKHEYDHLLRKAK